MKKKGAIVLLSMCMCFIALTVKAQNHVFDIQVNKPYAEVQPTMYGIFFEDINFAADGGLYAELVKNRSFEFPDPLMGWSRFGNMEIRQDGPFERCPHYVRLFASGHREKHTGLQNEGYFGIGLQAKTTYRFSLWARIPEGGKSQLSVMLVNPSTMDNRQQLTNATIDIEGKEWKKYQVVLTSPATVAKASLRVQLIGDTTTDVEHISLFPTDTWKGHENGLRKDVVQALADLHPGVFRFPGGCIVEGTSLATRYQWKKTVGPVENRQLQENRWNQCFEHRMFPDYFQSGGLGFFEFFQLAEEIGAEPLPILSVGLSCQYQNGPQRSSWHAGPDVASLQPYIDDVLDLIEFANGDASASNASKWAKLRAEMGHPAPFNLKFIGIGNEQWGKAYPENLKPFVEQVRKRYPGIKIVGSAGPNPEDIDTTHSDEYHKQLFPMGEQFTFLWQEMRKMKIDLVDEHYYMNDQWFLEHADRYNNYPRKGSKVFAGEYACHSDNFKPNHYEAAICEAAFMTGLERNADVVQMATYAPLFAHVDGWQWRPDLIWYDNLRTMRTSSWYVQQLFSTNKGTDVIPLTMAGKPVQGKDGQDGLYASAVIDRNEHVVIVKVVNAGVKAQDFTLNLKTMKGQRQAEIITFSNKDMLAENTLDEPNKVCPTKTSANINCPSHQLHIAAKSMLVIRVK